MLGILGIAAALALSAVGVMRYLHHAESAEANEPLDEMVEQARECARTRSWDSPPGANVKDLTDKALEQSPNDARILEIRHDAADKIVTQALGLKYKGDTEGATRLAKLAVEMNPDLPTAQQLLSELQAEAVAAEPTASATSTADAKAIPTASRML